MAGKKIELSSQDEAKELKEYYKRIDKILGFKPKDYSYYVKALTHSSMQVQSASGKINNERLEFLGDSILGFLMSDILFRLYTNKDEHELTKLRAFLVSRTRLNRIATEMGLESVIRGRFNANVIPDNVKGNALEAMIGAIYLDKGLKFVYEYIENIVLNKYVDFMQMANDEFDFKSELHIWSNRNQKKIHYETVKEVGRGDKKRYIINVISDKVVLGTGEGTSKKVAQKEACKNACYKLNLVKKNKLYNESFRDLRDSKRVKSAAAASSKFKILQFLKF